MTSTYEGLVPCQHRTVDDNGRILCGLIKGGDRGVTVNLCRDCPIPMINCQHLRAEMKKKVSTPITIRYATGRVEVWDDEAPTIGFKQAACAVKTMPVNSPRDCAGCPIRLPHAVQQNAIQVAHLAKSTQTANPPPLPASSMAAEGHAAPSPSFVASQRSDVGRPAKTESASGLVRRVQAAADKTSLGHARPTSISHAVKPEAGLAAEPGKIILLQQWLADQYNKERPGPNGSATTPGEGEVKEIAHSNIVPSNEEEPGYERCVGWTD